MSIDEQVALASRRRASAESRPGYEYRARIPAAQWPQGTRWCGPCQMFIPLDYCRGSQCLAHASEAAHRTRVKRVYAAEPDELSALLAWQGGRCFICGRKPRGRRLAIDHDHRTGAVRGWLCADGEWGCNKRFSIVLEAADPRPLAWRLLTYVDQSPLERMRAGQPGWPGVTPDQTAGSN